MRSPSTATAPLATRPMSAMASPRRGPGPATVTSCPACSIIRSTIIKMSDVSSQKPDERTLRDTSDIDSRCGIAQTPTESCRLGFHLFQLLMGYPTPALAWPAQQQVCPKQQGTGESLPYGH